MSVDPETLAVYQARAADYADRFGATKPGRILSQFIAALPKSARVLDLGCGPGDTAFLLQQAGFDVDPVDAAPAMVALARDRLGVPARVATFDDLDTIAGYGGVWANFSLLHAPRANLPRHLAAIRRALGPGGVFHIGMKLGTGEHRDTLGRLYTFVPHDALLALLDDAGFDVLTVDTTSDVGLAGVAEPGITVLSRTKPDA